MGKASADGRIHIFNLPRNWLHQALTYMEAGEMFVRIITEVLEFLMIYGVMIAIFGWLQASSWEYLLSAFVIVHTFNWLTNANFWALVLFSFPGLKNPGEEQTCAYLNKMAERLEKHESIIGIALFGSISRGTWHDRSDMDIRLICDPGIWNLINSEWLAMRERWLAFFAKQPTDLFLVTGTAFFMRMRADERPVFLLKRGPILQEEWPDDNPIKIERLKYER